MVHTHTHRTPAGNNPPQYYYYPLRSLLYLLYYYLPLFTGVKTVRPRRPGINLYIIISVCVCVHFAPKGYIVVYVRTLHRVLMRHLGYYFSSETVGLS